MVRKKNTPILREKGKTTFILDILALPILRFVVLNRIYDMETSYQEFYGSLINCAFL